MADEQTPQPARITLPDVQTEALVRKLIAEQVADGGPHDDLRGAQFSIVMKHNWHEDAEGSSPLGEMKVVSELTHRIMPEGEEADFVMVLNGQTWPNLDEKQRTYIIDELLCSGAPKTGKGGEQLVDVTGRMLWRKVKPDFVGYAGPLERHGVPAFVGVRKFAKSVSRAVDKSEQLGLDLNAPIPRATTAPAAGAHAN